MSIGEESFYIEKNSLNKKMLRVQYMLGIQKKFIALVIQKPRTIKEDEKSSFSTLSIRIKNNIKDEINKLKNHI